MSWHLLLNGSNGKAKIAKTLLILNKTIFSISAHLKENCKIMFRKTFLLITNHLKQNIEDVMTSRFKVSTTCLKTRTFDGSCVFLDDISEILSIFYLSLILKRNVNCRKLPLIKSTCWKTISCLFQANCLLIPIILFYLC